VAAMNLDQGISRTQLSHSKTAGFSRNNYTQQDEELEPAQLSRLQTLTTPFKMKDELRE
jgi:hypothetical protein